MESIWSSESDLTVRTGSRCFGPHRGHIKVAELRMVVLISNPQDGALTESPEAPGVHQENISRALMIGEPADNHDAELLKDKASRSI